MSRLAVVGPPGAGKTWLAVRLARATGLPLHDLDDLYWLPGWVRPSTSAWEDIQAKLVERPEWIIAGDYRQTLALRVRRATAVIVVDPGAVTCLRRLLLRTARIYLGDVKALPSEVRRDSRRHAGRGLTRIVRIGLRYRREGLPYVTSLAHRHGVPLLRIGQDPHVDFITRELTRISGGADGISGTDSTQIHTRTSRARKRMLPYMSPGGADD